MDGLPTSNDTAIVGIDFITANLPPRMKQTLPFLIHPPTLCALESDNSLGWPWAGKLRMKYTLRTALYCTTVEYENARTKGTVAPEGDTEMTEVLRSAEGRLTVRWELKATDDEINYAGFFPQCEEIVMSKHRLQRL